MRRMERRITISLFSGQRGQNDETVRNRLSRHFTPATVSLSRRPEVSRDDLGDGVAVVDVESFAAQDF